MGQPIRVLLVEDHGLMAEGLEALLGRAPDIEVLGVAGTVAAAIKMAESGKPGVIVMDFHLPDGDGAQAAAAIRRQQSGAAIVFVSGDQSEDALLAAVQAGACGFLSKSTVSADVVSAVRRASEGEMLIPSTRLAALLARVQERHRAGAERDRLRASLTPREREVLALMAQGLRNSEMASELGLGVSTVRSYVQDILEKLDCHSKLEAVLAAARNDLLAA